MSEWWTYSLHSFLLFSPQVYWRLIEQYNRALWPGQFLAALAGLVVLYGLARWRPRISRFATAVLGGGWLLVAWAFLAERYAAINWPVRYLVPLFVLEGLLLLGLSVRTPARPGPRQVSRLGLLLFAYALLLHPLATALSGHNWSAAELPGLLPDPTAIATLGFLLSRPQAPWGRVLMVVPVLWCLYSFLSLLAMGAPAAWVMLVVPGLVVLAIWRGRQRGPV